MNENEFLDEFISAVDPVDISIIAIDTELKTIPEWDSLAILGVIILFETSFNKQISGEVLASKITVRDIYNLI
jgi:acyl carrier protein